MRRLILAAMAASTALATPAMARDNSWYVEADAGGVFVQDMPFVLNGTPTGSTAYSLSAGGPIINPAVPSLILTPICPHTLTHRPLIVPASAQIEVVLPSKDDGAMATLDGQVGVALSQGDTVEIHASEHLTRLIRFPESSYYEVLREKLKWGDG